jgi:CspA family cold shock protein
MSKGNGNGHSNFLDGRIARLVRDRGFGFILGPQGTQYFFHMSALQNSRFDNLTEDQKVRFVAEEDPRGKGPRAGAVEVI